MGRPRGAAAGQTRSLRLPLAIDRWFEERLVREPHRPASDILVELVHGGLRLREGYMAIHRRALEALEPDGPEAIAYRAALLDTFGPAYVDHLERWLAADRLALTGR